jgi:HlyD family secretion protein
MSNFRISELLKNTAVRVALIIVALAIIASLTYYFIEVQPPSVVYTPVTTGNIMQVVTANGTVTPLQNPSLSFQQAGQVTAVDVSAGQKVSAGSLLATLDTGVLSASLEAAQAKLDELEAPPRSVDIAGQQTAVTNAEQTLQNTYANYPQTLVSIQTSAESAIYTQTDPLFNFSVPTEPALISNAGNSASRVKADGDRAELNTEFSEWQSELSLATSSPSDAEFNTLTQESLGHLYVIRSFLNDLIIAIEDENTSGAYTTSQTTGLASTNAALATINGLITSLTNSNQAITSQQLAVQSAQDQLNETNAGATSQTIEAQKAVVDGIEAQIAQEEIVAPFSGTIASVSIKPGDAVTPNTPVLALIPNGNFEVDVYLAENDVTKVKVGDTADVTLSAFGTGRIFPATVSEVDTSPSTDPNSADGTASGYKVTLVFDNADPAIANGMSAAATIHTGSAQNVLVIPASAVITDGSSQFVLKHTPQGPVQTPVTLGLTSTSTVEVLSGLSAGDSISLVGAQSQ